MRYIRKFLFSAASHSFVGTVIVLFSLTTCKKFDVDGFLYFETDASQSLGGGNYSLKGTLDDLGEAPITEHGFCWSEQQSPTTTGPSTREGQINAAGSFTSTISGLSPNTTYYYRAYMITSAGTEYANERSFVTESIAPAVTTTEVTGATETMAQGGGNVVSDGGSSITARGVCWNTTGTPEITDPKTTDAGTTGSYTSAITGLSCGTTYYVRAYATNSSGTSYGSQVQFATDECSSADPPTVTTSKVGGTTEVSAQGGGEVTNDGGATITARGVCWNTTGTPTTSDPKTTEDGTTDSYTSAITGLTCGTTYYVRAYASNVSGTSYGDQEEFTTNACTFDLPVVSTSTVSGTTETTAQGGGEVTNDGGTAITARGVCWNNTGTPTTNDPRTTEAGAIGSYTSAITGLTCGTTYYVRAYASNVSGTSYGDQEEFTTLACPLSKPSLTTSMVTGITETTAQGGGNVTDDGGASIIARGICWSTSQSPTTSDYSNPATGTTGSFTGSMPGLTCNTTYYVRAYAMNSEGTSYGNQEQFTTSTCPVANKPTVTTSSVTVTGPTTAQGGGDVTDDGGATIIDRGICWNTTGTPTTSDPKTTDAGTTGSYSSSIAGLSPFTTYYIRAYATNSAGTSYGSEMIIKTLWDNSPITDREGNQYNTYQIEDQVWMTEDMRATKYADGSDIPEITSTSEWNGQSYTNKAYCWYENNQSYGSDFGALYTWAAAMNGHSGSSSEPSGVQGVCPDGWHIPSDQEWKTLEIALGMDPGVANTSDVRGSNGEGGAMKEETLTYWESPNTGASNTSGLRAVGSGYRIPDGSFGDLRRFSLYWTATKGSGSNAWTRSLGFNTEDVGRTEETPTHGISVRCAKD